jgi:hypothetical protein
LLRRITDHDCTEQGLTSDACGTSYNLNLASTVVVFVFTGAFFVPYAVSGFYMWRAITLAAKLLRATALNPADEPPVTPRSHDTAPLQSTDK